MTVPNPADKNPRRNRVIAALCAGCAAIIPVTMWPTTAATIAVFIAAARFGWDLGDDDDHDED